MNIQISVVIWTVICFIALYFVLKYLLFIPVLSLIDARKEKSENAKKIEEENELKKAEITEKALKQREIDLAKRTEAAKIKKEQIYAEGKKRLEDAKSARLEKVSSFAEDLDEKFSSEFKTISEKTPEIADDFFVTLEYSLQKKALPVIEKDINA